MQPAHFLLDHLPAFADQLAKLHRITRLNDLIYDQSASRA